MADPLAPPTQDTFEALSSAERPPPEPYSPLDPDLAAWELPVPVVLNHVALLTRTAPVPFQMAVLVLNKFKERRV